MTHSDSLRARKKEQTRQAIIRAAWQLFRAKGYDTTTVDDIAAAADISRRTFFRYFPTKESVVFHNSPERLAAFRESIEEGGKGFESVTKACLEMARRYTLDKDAVLEQYRLIQSTPALVFHEGEIDREWVALMAEALATRRTSAAEHQANILAGAIFGAMRAVIAEWLDSDGKLELVELGAEALGFFSRDLTR